METRYPKIRLELIDPVWDPLGNNFSGNQCRMPKDLRDRIDRRLVLPNMRIIEDCRDNIVGVDGMECIALVHDVPHNYLYARFSFGASPDRWWIEMTPAK